MELWRPVCAVSVSAVSCPDVVVEEVAQRDGEHDPKRRAHIEPHAIVGGEPRSPQPTGGERARDFAL
eukprot:1707613-Prymnesium_polylepis.1